MKEPCPFSQFPVGVWMLTLAACFSFYSKEELGDSFGSVLRDALRGDVSDGFGGVLLLLTVGAFLSVLGLRAASSHSDRPNVKSLLLSVGAIVFGGWLIANLPAPEFDPEVVMDVRITLVPPVAAAFANIWLQTRGLFAGRRVPLPAPVPVPEDTRQGLTIRRTTIQIDEISMPAGSAEGPAWQSDPLSTALLRKAAGQPPVIEHDEWRSQPTTDAQRKRKIWSLLRRGG